MLFVSRQKINYPLLAKKMGMSLSGFKNKLYRPVDTYFFRDDEIIRLMAIFAQMAAELNQFVKKQFKGGTTVVFPQNIENNSGKFRATPILKSQKS